MANRIIDGFITQFQGWHDLGLKLQIIGEFGKKMANQIPQGVASPGKDLPIYQSASKTREIRQDFENAIEQCAVRPIKRVISTELIFENNSLLMIPDDKRDRTRSPSQGSPRHSIESVNSGSPNPSIVKSPSIAPASVSNEAVKVAPDYLESESQIQSVPGGYDYSDYYTLKSGKVSIGQDSYHTDSYPRTYQSNASTKIISCVFCDRKVYYEEMNAHLTSSCQKHFIDTTKND